MNPGWLIVLLTSATTICGCMVIYTDVIYKALFLKRYAKKPFHIANNTHFLVCSLSLSAGCLTFVSLYRLLPTATSYLKHIKKLKENTQLLQGATFACYVSGIACCSVLNILVHLLTSESVVHCVHEDNQHRMIVKDAHDHAEPHPHHHLHHHHHHDIENDAGLSIPTDVKPAPAVCKHCKHVHKLSTTQSSSQPSSHHPSPSSVTRGKQYIKNGRVSEIGKIQRSASDLSQPGSSLASSLSQSYTSSMDQSLAAQTDKSGEVASEIEGEVHPSVVDLSLKALKGEKMEGECYGDMECCCEEIAKNHHLHLHQNAQGLHFCCYPSEENQIFFKPNNGEMVTDKTEIAKRFPELEVNSPLLAKTHNEEYGSTSNSGSSAEASNALEVPLHSVEDETPSVAEEHTKMHEHHHHHVKTPLARLLSIGVQTVLAITMHKFPEGFIMYSTSQADARLGWTIFLSMFVHNFVEGFTMALPIYVALNSRWKALLISGTLGGFAQPLGALMGYFIFKHNGVDIDSPYSMGAIGGLIALTSGFLTYIGLQMLTSAVSFGGRQETVMKWTLSGVCLIFMTNIMI